MVPRTSRLLRLALDRPRTAIAVACLIVAAAAPGFLRLELRTDGGALVPEDAPEVRTDRAVRERFGTRDRIVVVLEAGGPHGIFESDLLRAVQELSAAFARLEGVGEEHVESLATEPSDRVRPGTLSFRPWLDPMPGTRADLERLRADLAAVGIYHGTLLSTDAPASAAAILVGVPPEADRGDLVRRIESAVRGEEAALAGRASFHVVGAPVAELRLGGHLLQDLALLVPLGFLLMAAVFWLAFRSAPAVLLPLIEVAACLALTFSVMGWCGAPVYLTVIVLPVILTAAGVTDELHLFTSFLRSLRDTGDPRRATERTLAEVGRPVVLTSLTTALGFLDFALAPVAPVRTFGLFMALAVLLCMAWSLLVLPAFLVLVPARTWRVERIGGRSGWVGRSEALLARLGRFVLAHRALVLGAFAGCAAVAPLLAARVRIQDSWTSGFARESAYALSTERVDELFGGTNVLEIALRAGAIEARGTLARGDVGAHEVWIPAQPEPDARIWRGHAMRLTPTETGSAASSLAGGLEARIVGAELEGSGTRIRLDPSGRPLDRWLPTGVAECHYAITGSGRMLEPALLEQAGQLERALAARADLGVGRALGPWEHLATMSFLASARAPGTREVPRDVRAVEQVVEHYVRARGAERLCRVLGPERADGLVTVLVRDADFVKTGRLLAAVRELEREHLAPLGVRIELAGDLAKSQAMVGGIVRTQVLSLGFGLATVLAAAWLLSRSFFWGLVTTLPAALAVLVCFAWMGAFGMPLGVATSMFAAMTVGIGVDYAIHLGVRYRRARARGVASDPAWIESLSDTGPAVVIDALALVLAFGILGLSAVPANARLGALMAASLATCLATSLVLLPALVRGPAFVRRPGLARDAEPGPDGG